MSKIIHTVDIERTETWIKYKDRLCDSCAATCCTLPVEVRLHDLVRMELIDEFEAQEAPKDIAKKLKKAKLVEHFNFKNELFTLTRLSNGDCLYLDRDRRCTIYAKRPDTCRNHPRIGPRPGFCAYREKRPR